MATSINPIKFGDITNSFGVWWKGTKDGVRTGDLAEMTARIKNGSKSSTAGLRNTISNIFSDAHSGTAENLVNDLFGAVDETTKEGKAKIIGALRKAGSSSVGIDDAGEYYLKDGWKNEQIKLGFLNKTKLAHMNLKTGGYDANKVAVTGAATYMTAASGYRLITGGGLYRDKDGNTDIVGIPFV